MKRLIAPLLATMLLAARAPAESDGREWASAGAPFDAGAFLAALATGTVHRGAWVTMRDGTPLATEVFLPPGQGPWPVVLMRTPYGRAGGAMYAKRFKDEAFVFVVQDTRGRGNSKGKVLPFDDRNEIDDGADTLDWIAAQPWCNGRIGMVGGSGHGHAARMAYLARHPNLVVVQAANSAGPMAEHWAFEQGVRKKTCEWPLGFRNGRDDGRKPTMPPARDEVSWAARYAHASQSNHTVLLVDDGWYNIFGDGGAVAELIRFGASGHVYGEVAPRAHGLITTGFTFPSAPKAGPPSPSFTALLKGDTNRPPSGLHYYVLGDLHTPGAPGNRWAFTATWPPPNQPVSFFLSADGSLARTPAAATGQARFQHDPRDPAPTLGGAHSYGAKDLVGPADQRPLLGRKDVLRFATAPLEAPLTFAGNAKLELFFSTDVPDTSLIVKLVDIYPDGLELLLREGAVLARLHTGANGPAPLQSGTVYRLSFPLASIAAALNTGHRLGLYVAGSSRPAYEVHPNIWEPVATYDAAPVAHHTLHTGARQASRLILPVQKIQPAP